MERNNINVTFDDVSEDQSSTSSSEFRGNRKLTKHRSLNVTVQGRARGGAVDGARRSKDDMDGDTGHLHDRYNALGGPHTGVKAQVRLVLGITSF